MKMKKCYSNDDLKESLKDSKAVIKGLTDFDLDDDEFNKLDSIIKKGSAS